MRQRHFGVVRQTESSVGDRCGQAGSAGADVRWIARGKAGIGAGVMKGAAFVRIWARTPKFVGKRCKSRM